VKREDYEYWLCSIDGIGVEKMNRLLKIFHTPEEIFSASEERLRSVRGIGEKELQSLLESRECCDIAAARRELEQYNMKCFPYLSASYPAALKEIYAPPKRIFCCGELPGEATTLAVVGARNCSHYGKEVARTFSHHLAAHGIGIISGMARGIDGWAHQGALEGGGKTYAVLGNSAEICYPLEHIRLYQSIRKRGGILSEYPPGTKAMPGFFPMRNRIISALSTGILVVEAREKSGSLITVEHALEQGKDVFVIPGRVGDELSVGCNNLIKQGAVPITSPEEILEFYGEIYKNGKENFRNFNIFLESREKMVYASLSLEPKHLNVLAEELEMESAEVMRSLLLLMKNHMIQEIGTHYYIKNLS
jgi:DNA processing protein